MQKQVNRRDFLKQAYRIGGAAALYNLGIPFNDVHRLEAIIVGQGGLGTSAADDYSDITFWWRCEGTTLDHPGNDYSAGDTTTVLAGIAAINTAAVKNGTNGLDCPTSASYAPFAISSNDIIVAAEGRIGFWLRVTTWVDGAYITEWRDGSGDDRVHPQLNGTDELKFYWKDGGTERTSLISTDANLSTGTWYFVEFAWKTSTDYREIFVGGVSKGSSSATINASPDNIYFRLGNTGSTLSDLHEDHLIISNDSTRDLYALKDTDNYPG